MSKVWKFRATMDMMSSLCCAARRFRQWSMAAWKSAYLACSQQWKAFFLTKFQSRSIRLRFGEYEGRSSSATWGSRTSVCQKSG